MSIISSIDLNDSEILKLEKGPLTWARLRQGSSMDIDQFVKSLEEQINQCGFTVEVKVLETNEPGVYAFTAEINGRTAGSVFDPDRQVHEVTHNLLQLPGETTGFIPSKDGIARLLQREKEKARHKH
jgi:hypothetical protein